MPCSKVYSKANIPKETMPLGDPLPSGFLSSLGLAIGSGRAVMGGLFGYESSLGTDIMLSLWPSLFAMRDCLWSPSLASEHPIFPRYRCLWLDTRYSKHHYISLHCGSRDGADEICPCVVSTLAPSQEGECIPLPPPC